MVGQLLQIAAMLAAVLAGRFVVKRMTGAARDAVFALLNVAALYLLFFQGKGSHAVIAFCAYVGLGIIQYSTLRLFGSMKGSGPWLAFFTPILALVLVRYLPVSWPGGTGLRTVAVFFAGISYLAFRCSLLALEVRNGVVPMPGFFRYLGFCFFAPTMAVGPINSYANYHRAFTSEPPELPVGRAGLRILVGFVKYKFIGNICFQLTYANLLFDDHFHPGSDLAVAMLFYYLFLYCNFSGFCDIAIGAAALIGIPVPENFNDPFVARNLRDFWNRWHITLSVWMRDIVFSPLSKYFVRLFGPANADHAIALAVGIIFLLIGVWHGVGWNFAIYGAVHALGVVTNHYYAIFLKKRLGRERFKAYNENKWIRAAAVTFTFCYCAASLIFFANTLPQIRQILSILK